MIRLMFSRYWLLLPLLLSAVLVTHWAEDWGDEATSTDGENDGFDMRSSQSDYYLEAFRTRRYDAQGKPEYRVSGDSLTHYPDSRRSDIVAPSIALIEAESEWKVTARQGVFTEAPELFRLTDDVVIARQGGSEESLVIRTAELELLPDSREVRTDQAIEIVADSWQLRAIGLRSTLETGNLKLLNEVTGTYAAPAPDDE